MNEYESLDVFLYEQKIGTIIHLPGDKNLFTFHDDYVGNLNRPTLSLSFKDTLGELITDTKSYRTRLSPFFSNLLPEGHLREYLALKADVNPQREFFLMKALGKDLPGALQILASSNFSIPEVILEDGNPKEEKEDFFHFSLAGVQLKFSAIWETHGGLTIPAQGIGGAWIVKLPSSIYADVPENEYSMMELARRIGIHVPETSLIPMKKIKGLPKDIATNNYAFVIKRFDRDENGLGIHIEDFAQVFGVYPEKKYNSANYRNICEVIWNEMGDSGVIEFLKRFVFNVLIGNGDMHLKNWSLIYPDRIHPQLAPAYDFVSTIPYLPNDNLALNFGKSKAFNALTFDLFKYFANKSSLSEKLVIDTVKETVSLFKDVWNNCNDLPLNSHFKKIINEHLSTIPFYR